MEEKFTFLKEEWFMWLMLVIFAPAGIFLMWKYDKKLQTEIKYIISAGSLVLLVFIWAPLFVNKQSNSDNQIKNQVATETKAKEEKAAADKVAADQAAADKAVADKAAAEKAAADQAAADQAAAEKAAADKAAADQAAAEKAAADKAAADQAAAEKAAADQAAEQAAANTATDSNGNEILPANTQWVTAWGHLWVGVDLYYLNSNKEGIKYATIMGFSDGAQMVECYMYESDTIKTFNRKDPQFTGTFLHVRADDPHLQ